MKYSIGKMISKSIKENKWLSIEYVNKNNEQSSFWCSVLDIDINGKSLAVDIFNIFKGNKILNGNIYFGNILKASVVDGTYYSYEQSLIKKIETNMGMLELREL